MPVQIPLDSLISTLSQGMNAGNPNQAFTLDPTGKFVANPAYLNEAQQAQLSQTVNGPTPAAIQGAAIQSAATKGAELGAANAVLPQTPVPATDLTNLNVYDPTTGIASSPAVGTTYGQLQNVPTLSSTQRDALGGLNAVQNILDQVKAASKAVNVNDGPGGILGQRSAAQAIHALTLKLQDDPNYNYLDTQVKAQLGELASGALGTNRFSPEEIAAIQDLIPNPTDTKTTAAAKIGHLQTLVDTEKKQIIPQVIQESVMGPQLPQASGGM